MAALRDKTRKKFRGYEVRRLLRACKDGRLTDVNSLIAQGHDPNGHDDVFGDRPLHFAARAGHISVARALLSAGGDIEAKIGYQGIARPLDCAAEAGQVAMVKFLISRGAKINIAGESPALFAAVRAGELKTAALLIRSGAKRSKDILYWAVRSGNVALVELLLKTGEDVNGDGETTRPVRAAARLESGAEMLKLLVKNGASIHSRGGSDGRTLLHHVMSEDSALYLIQGGADVHAVDHQGQTPLHRCAKRGYVRACRALLDAGADVRAKTRYGVTPRQMSVGALTGPGPAYELLTEALKHTARRKRKVS